MINVIYQIIFDQRHERTGAISKLKSRKCIRLLNLLGLSKPLSVLFYMIKPRYANQLRVTLIKRIERLSCVLIAL
jgi:hypothetical protein